jgi:hypothetical protein
MVDVTLRIQNLQYNAAWTFHALPGSIRLQLKSHALIQRGNAVYLGVGEF